MRLKMLLDTVGQWWKPVNGTVSMWDLTMARLLVKLCRGLTSILSLAEQVTWKIREAALGIQSRAKATISRRTIEQINPVQNVGYQVGTGIQYQLTNNISNNMITFNNQESKPVLVITHNGDVEWHGKPSEAADALVQTFQFTVENKKGITKAARRRYYLRACQNILNKAEKMEQDQFLDFLRKQVYNKQRRVIMDGLKGEE
jgi:hypothetical protein